MLCGAIAAAAWLFFAPRQESHPLPLAVLPLLAAVCLALVQLIPLSHDTIATISPGAAELRSELADAPTAPLSLYPASTRLDLYRLSLAIGLFALAACVFSDAHTLALACTLIGLNGAAIAVFGIVQRLTWNGHMFWSVPLSRGVPFGPFINKNNAAAICCCALPPRWACWCGAL